MFAFRQRTIWESIRYRISPSYRAMQDAETKAAIKELCDHPEAPCIIGDRLIPNGYGGTTDWLGLKL